MKRSRTTNVIRLEMEERIEGMRVGRILSVGSDGEVIVYFPGGPVGGVAARFASSLNLKRLREAFSEGRDVLLVFENSDPGLPIIIDTMHSLLDEVTEPNEAVIEGEKPEDVFIDGRRITFDAQEEIVLRCGKSSITLTRAGKVIIRGAYLLSRSSGVNRIKGGSVQIN